MQDNIFNAEKINCIIKYSMGGQSSDILSDIDIENKYEAEAVFKRRFK